MKKTIYFFALIFVFSFFILNIIKADIRMLYNTNFQDWVAVSNPTTEVNINKTTSFSNETLTFKLLKVSVIPDKYDNTRFNYNIVTTGALMAEKMTSATDLSYIETTPLKSITKIFVTIGATGSNRGFKIQKKADGDANWVDIYTAVANPASGDSTTITIPGGQSNVALKFTNLAFAQNAYLFDLQIFGEYSSNIPQKTLTTSVNIPEAGYIIKSPISETYDENSIVTLQAKNNFGYKFDNWIELPSNTVLSTDKNYNVTMDNNKNIQAVFHQIDTYELILNTDGGAKNYMINASPAPTVVGGKNMYEDGTNVTLSASNNDILTFTNWESNETNAVRAISMTENKNITAVYSAIDFVAAWDFYMPGNGGRTADFASNTENEASALVLRLADGTTSSWLDKSQVAAGGYEGAPAAVNWKPLVDNYYYQIAVNATDFTNLSVKSSMLFNYNAYSVQKVEYSLNGTDFTTLGQLEMTNAKVWYPTTFALPAAADHAPKVYIRWIPDYSSAVVGSTSNNDGTAISGIYVFGNKEVPNDGIAPVLVSSVPSNNASGATAAGKVVLNFDEKVQIVGGTKATIGTKELTPVVSGKTITFSYTGLDYNTAYTFSLPANTVSDLSGNTLTTIININFNTMNRPVVTKKVFDFVVGVDGDFKAALTAAQAASASGNRFYIFFPDGEYNIGTNTGDANQMTTITVPNLSIIGQSANVMLYNQSIQESINSTATMYFTSGSSNNYLQDIILRNKMDFRTGSLKGRGVALWDQGNKNIYKNVKLQSNQDTYYSGSGRSYFENSDIHGTVDFFCGGGDVFFNECLIYLEDRSGNCITAPATSSNWGYVFNNCTIDGFPSNNNSYRLGRPWSNAPKAVYLNTTMKVLPISAGWGDPMNVVPAVFAEYNSMTANGAQIDLSGRRTTYTKDATTVVLNPVLSAAEAANYTVENVLGGTDAWQPKLYTDQVAAPVIASMNNRIVWDDNNYVLCWAVFRDNNFETFVTTNSYEIPIPIGFSSGASKISNGASVYTIRAANEMGGLGAASNAVEIITGVDNVNYNAVKISEEYFTIEGKKLQNFDNYRGVVLKRTKYSNGNVVTEKIMKTEF